MSGRRRNSEDDGAAGRLPGPAASCRVVRVRAVLRCIACAAALTPPLPPLRKGGKVGGVWSFFPPCEGGTQGGASSASALCQGSSSTRLKIALAAELFDIPRWYVWQRIPARIRRTGCGIMDKTHVARNRFSLTLRLPFPIGVSMAYHSGVGERMNGRPDEAPRPPAWLASAHGWLLRATAMGLPRRAASSPRA